MSSKSARGTSSATAATGGELREEVDRLIEKERFKDAVKQAKLVFKQQATPENHKLLERAYFLRARQLMQLGMPASAVEVVHHLLEFGLTTSDWADEFIRLLMGVGLNNEALTIQDRFGSPEKKDMLVAMAADEAVIHSDRQQGASPEIARDATLIRESLERLQAKDEAGALLLLRDLARSSALSEWKFFVRGLAAYYRRDANDTKANWDRLDPKRKAFPIAQRLLRLRETDGKQPGNTKTEVMEKLAFGEPVLDRLWQLSALSADQDWDKVLRLLGSVSISLRRIDPKLAERLTGALMGSIIKQTEDLEFPDAEHLVKRFTKVAEPMGFDPHWNRLWAIIWDGPQGDTEGSLNYWLRYVEDLKTVTVFNASERALAQALVWNCMAGQYRDLAADLAEGEGEGPFGLPSFLPTSTGAGLPEVNQARQDMIKCLNKSLELAPDHLPTYQLLLEAYRGWDDAVKVESAAKRLLAKFPEDLDTLRLLAKQYMKKNEPAPALPLVQRARALKPLDESLRELEWNIRVGLARLYAIAKNWDAGRNEFTAAEQLLPECRNQYFYLARRVIFEATASQRELSDQYLEQARKSLEEPTPLWLGLLIESIRYRMTKAAQKGYAQQWESELKNKCTSESAGEMASLMDAFVAAGTDYTGRAGHIKKVLAYLQRTTQLKYRCVDIERVCEFLGNFEEKVTLLEKLLKLGVKQHPRSALLNFRAGLIESGRGPFNFGGPKARTYLETARKLAESSTEPKETALLPQIENALTLLNEMSSRTMGFPAFGDFPPGFPFPGPGGNFFDFFDDDFDDDDDDDDDDPGPAPAAKPSAPRRPKKPKSSKKR